MERLKGILKGCLIALVILVVGFFALGLALSLVFDTEGDAASPQPAATPVPTSKPVTRGPWPTSRGGGVIYTPTPVGTLTPTPIPTPDPNATPAPTRRPKPTPTPFPAVRAEDVYYEYLSNEPRTNQVYKRRWLTVTLDNIDPIEDAGKVVKQANYGERIQLDFKNKRETLWLNPGDDVTAVCKLAGKESQWLTGGFVVRFFDCRLVPKAAPTPKPTPTAVPTPSFEQYSCELLAESVQFSSKNHHPDGYIVAVMDLTQVRQEPNVKECEARVELSNGELKGLRIRSVMYDDGSVRTGYELSELE